MFLAWQKHIKITKTNFMTQVKLLSFVKLVILKLNLLK